MSPDLLPTFERITGRRPLVEAPTGFKESAKPNSFLRRLKLEILKFVFPIAYGRVDNFPISEVALKRRPTLGFVTTDVALMAGTIGILWGISGRVEVGIGTLVLGKTLGRFNIHAGKVISEA